MRKTLPWLLVCGFTFLLATCAIGRRAEQKSQRQIRPARPYRASQRSARPDQDKTDQLAAKIADLRKHPKHHDLLPDVEIYLRAAENIVRFKEFYTKDSGKWTLDVLDRGLKRAEQLAGDKKTMPWIKLSDAKVGARLSLRHRRHRSALRRHLSRQVRPGKDQQTMARRCRPAWPRQHADRGRFPEHPQRQRQGLQGSGLGADRHLRPRQQRLPLGRRDRRPRSDRSVLGRRNEARPGAALRPVTARSCCAASRWGAPAPGTSACTIPTSGASWAPAPASPRRMATPGRARKSCRTIRRNACASTTPSITPRTPAMSRSSPTPAARSAKAGGRQHRETLEGTEDRRA